MLPYFTTSKVFAELSLTSLTRFLNKKTLWEFPLPRYSFFLVPLLTNHTSVAFPLCTIPKKAARIPKSPPVSHTSVSSRCSFLGANWWNPQHILLHTRCLLGSWPIFRGPTSSVALALVVLRVASSEQDRPRTPLARQLDSLSTFENSVKTAFWNFLILWIFLWSKRLFPSTMDTIEIETEKPINGVSHEVSNDIQNGFSNVHNESSSENIIKEIKSSLQVCPSYITTGASSLNGSMLKQDLFYPYQKAHYISPSYNLSSDSKRMIRRMQEPCYAAAPSTVHIVYEVWKLHQWNVSLKTKIYRSFLVCCAVFSSRALLYDKLYYALSNIFACKISS